MLLIIVPKEITGCGGSVVDISPRAQKVLSFKEWTIAYKKLGIKVGSNCSFAKSSKFRIENHGTFGNDLRNGFP
jgi:hypothetical protein